MKQNRLLTKISVTAIALFTGAQLLAQPQTIAWARDLGGSMEDGGSDVAVDASGNVYTIGYFDGTVDFDPGPGTFNMAATNQVGRRDIYISKLNAAGNFVWAKQVAARTPNTFCYRAQIAVDNNGDIIYTGIFAGTVDFDPNGGVLNITGDQYWNIFVCKISAAGFLTWVKTIEGPAAQIVCGLTTDASGNVYTTGYYQDSTDFDPGTGVYNLGSAPGYFSAFVCKWDNAGSFVWAKRMGGAGGQDLGNAVALDGAGNVYVTGIFDGTEDFDPGPATSNLVSAVNLGAFVLKLDASGNFVWAKATAGASGNQYARGYALTADQQGNVTYAGTFSGPLDFDPGAGVTTLGSGGNADMFVSRLDASGNFVWAKAFTGSGATNLIFDMTLNAAGDIYMTGNFTDSVDFDPGVGVYTLNAGFLVQTFFSKLDPSGNFTWTNTFVNGNSSGRSIVLDGTESIYLTGILNDYWTVDFDPTSGVYTLPPATGYSDAYVTKFSPADLNVFEQNGKNTLLLYPNPANTTLNIQNPTGLPATLKLYSMPGELIGSYEMQSATMQLNISDLSPGMYFIIAETGEGRAVTKVQVMH